MRQERTGKVKVVRRRTNSATETKSLNYPTNQPPKREGGKRKRSAKIRLGCRSKGQGNVRGKKARDNYKNPREGEHRRTGPRAGGRKDWEPKNVTTRREGKATGAVKRKDERVPSGSSNSVKSQNIKNWPTPTRGGQPTQSVQPSRPEKGEQPKKWA